MDTEMQARTDACKMRKKLEQSSTVFTVTRPISYRSSLKLGNRAQLLYNIGFTST